MKTRGALGLPAQGDEPGRSEPSPHALTSSEAAGGREGLPRASVAGGESVVLPVLVSGRARQCAAGRGEGRRGACLCRRGLPGAFCRVTNTARPNAELSVPGRKAPAPKHRGAHGTRQPWGLREAKPGTWLRCGGQCHLLSTAGRQEPANEAPSRGEGRQQPSHCPHCSPATRGRF